MAQAAHERRSYDQFCPLARTLDVIGERWTLLVVRELLVSPLRFSDLRRRLPGIGPALLTQRLRDLERAGLVRRAELPPPAARIVYELTTDGRALEPVVYEIARFGLRYLDMPTEEQPMPPHLLVNGVKMLVVTEALPRRAFVVHLAFAEGDFTVRVAPPQPGPPLGRVTAQERAPERADATITGSAGVAVWVRQGVLSLADARKQKLLTIAGSPKDVDTAIALFGFH
jgi:DNA-binding HxlR family transcriptional regulator